MREESPDILCLQELKGQAEVIGTSDFEELGYVHIAMRGQKSYNGVAIFSRIPFAETYSRDFLGNGQARHVACRLASGTVIENFYVPAGGDVPDRDVNPKFGDKLDFLDGMTKWSREDRPRRTILVGDLNIAPLEDDVWSHRQLLKVVSHTPIETERLAGLQVAGGWIDITRKDIPTGKLYSWWSYRARDWRASDRGRRLDHVWSTGDIAAAGHSSRILKDVRGWPRPSDHAPVFASFDL